MKCGADFNELVIEWKLKSKDNDNISGYISPSKNGENQFKRDNQRLPLKKISKKISKQFTFK